MSNLFVKPALDAEGKPVLVRDPANWQPLKAEGDYKPPTLYWLRRIRDKDVILVEQPEASPATATAPPAVAL
ncbi:DUF2635 domain-containing protein [Bradyrhizobium sp. SZCCHNR3118]|uniref:DUF2635 domain-containing protein n=1 Tax=Bradyrhizobium sp. SZCCHNR3118 TaxID=3057468 RepID=UPI00291634CC|nr:DUF2635 domain-containing protein [Bradyrhizobium sp. SZCCHNR3118]